MTPGNLTVVHDLKSFIIFRTAMFSNTIQTRRENEKHRELLARKDRALNNKLKGGKTPPGSSKKGGKNRFDKNKRNLSDPKDDPRRVRNPHSKLMKEKLFAKRKPTEDRDMSKINNNNNNNNNS